MVPREENPPTSLVLVELDPPRVTPGQQRRPRRRAHPAGHVEAREASPLVGQAIEVGSPVLRGAETAEITVAEVVREDQDDVRRALLVLGLNGERGCGREEGDHQNDDPRADGGGAGLNRYHGRLSEKKGVGLFCPKPPRFPRGFWNVRPAPLSPPDHRKHPRGCVASTILAMMRESADPATGRMLRESRP